MDALGGEMTNETLKALAMIAMFGLLETALYMPQLRKLQIWTSLRRSAVLLWPAVPPAYALQPMRARRRSRRH